MVGNSGAARTVRRWNEIHHKKKSHSRNTFARVCFVDYRRASARWTVVSFCLALCAQFDWPLPYGATFSFGALCFISLPFPPLDFLSLSLSLSLSLLSTKIIDEMEKKKERKREKLCSCWRIKWKRGEENWKWGRERGSEVGVVRAKRGRERKRKSSQNTFSLSLSLSLSLFTCWMLNHSILCVCVFTFSLSVSYLPFFFSAFSSR